MPGEDATEEEVQDFIKKSNSAVSHYLEQEGFALPEGVLVLYDPESNTLTARAIGLFKDHSPLFRKISRHLRKIHFD